MAVAEELGFRNFSRTRHINPANLYHLKILAVIEERRRAVVQAAWQQTDVYQSTSVDHLHELNTGERHWNDTYGPQTSEIMNDIFGLQADERYQDHMAWIQTHGSDWERQHFMRIRENLVPPLRDHSVPDIFKNVDQTMGYLSVLPWFPDRAPLVSTHLPADMTDKEWTRLSAKNLEPTDPFFAGMGADDIARIKAEAPDPSHPIFAPYTVVERLDPSQIDTTPTEEGKRWVVRVGEQAFLVTNMVFHERFRERFQTLAKLLRASASDGACQGITTSFQHLLLTMADAFDNTGDFERLLNADLFQTDGNLHFTAFPHEGYWPHVKFPVMSCVGVKQESVYQMIQPYKDTFAAVEAAQRERAISEHGFDPGPGQVADADLRRSFRMVYITGAGGFFRAFAHGDVAGHDYPKVAYASVLDHINVVIADTVEVTKAAMGRMIAAFFKPQEIPLIDLTINKLLVALHEFGHVLLGNRPSSMTAKGITVEKAYGDFWGFLAEPHSDLTDVEVIERYRESGGQISDDDYQKILRSFMYAFIFRRLRVALPTEDTAGEKTFAKLVARGDQHCFGSHVYTGLLCAEGVLKMEAGELVIDYQRLFPVLRNEFWLLTDFGLSGDTEAYKAHTKKRLAQIDPAVLAYAVGVNTATSRDKLVWRPGGEHGDFRLFESLGKTVLLPN